MSETTPARVRFAPSPTGSLHLGSALVAVANAAYARAHHASLVLRIDDTDRERSRIEDVAGVIDGLRRLGVVWDEGPIHQSDRAVPYRRALELLLADDHVYPCFCTQERLAELRAQQERAGEPSRYDGRCRALSEHERRRTLDAGAPHVLRFAVPTGRDVRFTDLVKGAVVVPAGSFGDPVVQRTDGSVGYLFSSVVDDRDLGITLVMRGEDHLHNTARQLLLIEALEAPVPQFAHLPLLRDSEGRKLSKRDPLGTIDELFEAGYLARTVRRYLAELLGQGAVDLLDPDEPRGSFHLNRVPSGAPRVDLARLQSIGREDIGEMEPVELMRAAGAIGGLADAAVIPLVRELGRESATLIELRGALALVFDGPMVGDLAMLIRMVAADGGEEPLRAFDAALEAAVATVRELGTDADAAELVAGIRARGKDAGLATKAVLQPVRLALTGTTGGPGLELLLRAVGGAEALRRLHTARAVTEELRQPAGSDGE